MAPNSEEDQPSPTLTPATTLSKAKRQRKRQPQIGGTKRGMLVYDGRCHTFKSESKSSLHYRCTLRRCFGRLIKSIATGEVLVSQEHICQPRFTQREGFNLEEVKKTALDKLREMTISTGGEKEGVSAANIVRQFCKEVSPDVRAVLPCDDRLRRKVRDWAKEEGMELARSTFADHLEEGEVEEPAASSAAVPVKKEQVEGDPPPEVGEGVSTGQGVEFFSGGPGGGKPRIKINNKLYVWTTDLKSGGSLYKCQTWARTGCRVTVKVFGEGKGKQKSYEIQGTHVHRHGALLENSRGYSKRVKLKLVDEEGRDLGRVPLDQIATAGDDSITFSSDYDTLSRTDNSSATEKKYIRDREISHSSLPDLGVADADERAGGGDYDDCEGGGDDDGCPLDSHFDDHSDSDEPATAPVHLKKLTNSPKTISTSSTPDANASSSSKETRSRGKEGMKSGEKCFVCGDDLMVSETLSSNQDTFRKACSYLNVKTERDWFPQSSNGQANYFCESCTTEITRIQKLYQKVEEIQSLIFQKVEHVEKRIADAVIVDNWQDEAPPISAIRLEGFRKQVLINYRNKLKLRREIRVGRKMGHVFTEIEPNSSAHMFASDPAETSAFRRVGVEAPSPTINPEQDNSTTNLKSNCKSENYLRSTRTRRSGRTSKSQDDPVDESNSEMLCSNNETLEDAGDDNEDAEGIADFHGFDDNTSVTSEKEAKFWVEDPSQLQVGNTEAPLNDMDAEESNEGGNDNNVDDNQSNADESDPEYEADDNDNDDDEDWGAPTTKRRKGSQTPIKKAEGTPKPSQITTTSPTRTTSTRKPPKKYEYPEAVLRKDGRLFLSGIEIIKNPPGAYARHPNSTSFTCGACNKVNVKFFEIRNHICGHHLGMFNCNSCDKQFAERKSLHFHVRRAHSVIPIEVPPCPICGKPIVKSTNMRYHQWSHLSEEEKKDPQYKNYCPPHKRDPNRVKSNYGLQTYICSYCSKVFYNMRALRTHELSHTGDAPTFQCQYCGKIFRNRKCLHGHNQACSKKALGIESTVRYPCPKCPVSFKSRQVRQKHMKKFHNIGNTATTSSKAALPYSCTKCTRRFSTQRGFKTHKRVCIEGRGIGSRDSSSQPQPSTSTTSSIGHGADQDYSESMSPKDGNNEGTSHSSTSTGLPGGSTAFGYNMFGNYPGGNIYHP